MYDINYTAPIPHFSIELKHFAFILQTALANYGILHKDVHPVLNANYTVYFTDVTRWIQKQQLMENYIVSTKFLH